MSCPDKPERFVSARSRASSGGLVLRRLHRIVMTPGNRPKDGIGVSDQLFLDRFRVMRDRPDSDAPVQSIYFDVGLFHRARWQLFNQPLQGKSQFSYCVWAPTFAFIPIVHHFNHPLSLDRLGVQVSFWPGPTLSLPEVSGPRHHNVFPNASSIGKNRNPFHP